MLQAGAITIVLAAVTYKVFELDRFFVPKELVLHLTAFVGGVCALGVVRRTPATRVDALLVAFLVVSALSAVFATNVWAAARALAISVSGVTLFWAARGLRQVDLSRPLLDALALGVVLAAVMALLQAYGLEPDLFSINRAPGGTLGNRNFVGHLAAFGLPVLLFVALRADRLRGFLLGAGGLMLVAGALVLTRSRAAWLGVAVVLAVLLVGGALTPSVRRSGRLIGRFVLLLLVAAGGVAAAVTLPNALRWRSDTPYLETARDVVNYREGSGRGRLVQYATSLRVALAHPLFGAGPGNWPVEYVAFAADDDPSLDRGEGGMTANPWPSSDWVALIAERGLAAFILFVLVGLGLAAGAWRTMRTATTPGEGLGALVVLATLAGAATTGAFDAVLLLAWPTLFVWAAVGALWSPEQARPARVTPWGGTVALLLVALLSGAAAVRSAGQLAAMGLYAADESREALERAAALDPGSYRVHLRLAHRYRDREQRCEHALAARDLYPHATAARRLARRCE